MKTRFSTLDIIAIIPELKAKICTGWRINQVYDCDYKTYIFKLNKSIVKMKKDDDPLSVDEEVANKMSFIIESGLRMHTTDYDWPKSHAPGHFATKLRKAIRNKRIENISQIGIDRAVDIQIGSSVAANHLIVELYDRGNLVLTDNSYTILAILRWKKPTGKKEGDEVDQNDSENFRVGDKYPLHLARKEEDLVNMTEQKIIEMLNNAHIHLGNNQKYKKRNKQNQDSDRFLEINLKDLFNPYVLYGSSLLEDRLIEHVFDNRKITKCAIKIEKIDSERLDQDQVKHYASLIKKALVDADRILAGVRERQKSQGYIVQKKQDTNISNQISEQNKKMRINGGDDKPIDKSYVTNLDFFPIGSCAQRKVDQETNGSLVIEEYESFDKAIDIYYSNLESQKIDTQALTAEKEAMKKLGNLKLAQEKRLDDLARIQREDEEKARLIELNCDKVENALLVIRSMIANQIPWSEIWDTIREAQSMKDPVASLITQVKFDRNEFTMKLCDPYDESIEADEDMAGKEEHSKSKETKNNKKNKKKNRNDNQSDLNSKHRSVDIDISLSAYANARRFFDRRRTAVNKERKTVEVSKKALKNVERQTKERLKEVVVKTNITKARKRYWFENFFWFISSDGYLVVAGRDSEQNESLVKRYMKNNDIYVHADLHGASSVIIKNESSDPVPPKTLTEAGTMAVCYSSAWDSKMATISWWVTPKQVSKTAPAGEYLTQGAFVIRGKKNFLPLSNLVLGFGLLFRLDEESIERRKKERLNHARNFQEIVTSRDNDKLKEDDSEARENDDESSDDESSDQEATNDHPSIQAQKIINSAKDAQGDEVEKSSKDGDGIDDEDEFDDDDLNKTTEHKLNDTLTENPSADDILLYSIPVCGPYTALQNYKFKVKVVPGANKRGKAAKSCLGMFLCDKKATNREKDLLRALKDQDYARNIPNKVKISAPNMNSITKRKPKKSEVRLPQR